MALPQPLLDFIGPPLAPPVPPDWDLIAGSLGTGLPADYMELAETYPMLKLGDWLLIAHPSVPPPDHDVDNLSTLQQWALQSRFVTDRQVRELHIHDPATGRTHVRPLPQNTLPYPAYPEPEGLMAWGSAEERGTWCWHTRGHPDSWTVVIVDSDMAWEYLGTTTQLLSDVATGQADSPLIPASLARCGSWTEQFLV
ncbi:hypothetical protein [Actinomadura kijaniata]|uniref:hypothetical protein n=1 Tax=Actinomadura kijaniata TaxID=46161 RepID=UPI00082AB7B3|nr:hypothetical protein [Actinomadura kijaniata]